MGPDPHTEENTLCPMNYDGTPLPHGTGCTCQTQTPVWEFTAIPYFEPLPYFCKRCGKEHKEDYCIK